MVLKKIINILKDIGSSKINIQEEHIFNYVQHKLSYQNKYKKFEKVTLSNCNKILVVTKKDIPYVHFYAKK